MVGIFRGKNFRDFCGFMAERKSFLREIWGRGVFQHGKSEQSAKVFSAEIILFTNLQEYSPSKVSRYTVPWLQGFIIPNSRAWFPNDKFLATMVHMYIAYLIGQCSKRHP